MTPRLNTQHSLEWNAQAARHQPVGHSSPYTL